MARRKKAPLGWRGRVLGIAFLVLGIVFIPSAILLCVGMLPAAIALLVDRSGKAVRGLTVGAMNLAGCSLFLVQLWTHGNKVETALSIIANPQTIIVIYNAAAAGYMIDWALTGIVSTLMVQKGQARQKEIAKIQTQLVERWGPEVTGEIPLDSYGFPLNSDENPGEKAK